MGFAPMAFPPNIRVAILGGLKGCARGGCSPGGSLPPWQVANPEAADAPELLPASRQFIGRFVQQPPQLPGGVLRRAQDDGRGGLPPEVAEDVLPRAPHAVAR